MDELSRALGQLQGTMKAVHEDVVEIKRDVKALQSVRWRVAGGAALLVFVLSIAAELMRR